MTATGPVLSKNERDYMTVQSWATGTVEFIERSGSMTAPALLLWMDLETTGDDPKDDVILEVGAILTDTDLNRLETFDWMVKDPLAKSKLANAPAVVQEMHDLSGLSLMVNSGYGVSLGAVERDLVAGCRGRLQEGQTVVLAGSGVGHFDFPFVKKQMPALAELLAYYVIDVGVLRRSFEMWGHGDMLIEKGHKPHRALEDAELHLREAQTIKKSLDDLQSLAFPNRVPVSKTGKLFIDGVEVGTATGYEISDVDVVHIWQCTSCPAEVPFAQRAEHISSVHGDGGDEIEELANRALDAAMSDGVMKVTPAEMQLISSYAKFHSGFRMVGQETSWSAAVAKAAARRGVMEPDGLPPVEIVVAK